MTNLKALFALFLGLVFQLAQVQAGAAVKEQPRGMENCGCASCPCLRSQPSAPRQAPSTPAPETVKVAAVRADATDKLTAAIATPPAVEMPTAEVVFQRFTGYPGVAASISFCRFLM